MKTGKSKTSRGAARRVGKTNVARNITARKQAEKALRESEERYRSLFENMLEGFAYCQMIFEHDQPQDSIYLAVNRAFEELTGLKNVIGKKLTEVIPEIRESNPELFEIYGRVAMTGKPEQFEVCLEPLGGRWLSISVYSPAKGYFIAIFDNITKRKRAEAEIQRRADEFAALYDSARDLSTLTDLTSLLQTTVERATTLLATQSGFIYLYDAEQGDLELAITKNLNTPLDARLKLGEDASGKAAQTLQPIIVDNYHAWEQRSSKYDQLPITSILGVPMLYGGELIGVLAINSLEPVSRKFTEADAQLLSLFAGQAASAVHNARLFDETRQRLAGLQALNRVSTALRTASTLDEMLPLLLNETLAVLNTTAGAVSFYDSQHDELRQVVARGWFTQTSQSAKANDGIAGQVFKTGQPYVTREFKSDPVTSELARAQIPEAWGGALVPIRAAEEIIGTLGASVQLPRELTREEMRLLNTLAEIAGTAIQRTRLHAETQHRLSMVQSLHAIDMAISSSLDLRVTLNVFLEHVTTLLNVDATDVLLLNPQMSILEFAAARGFRTKMIERSHLRLGEGYAGKAALERRTMRIANLPAVGDAFVRQALLAAEGFVAYYGVPLIAKGQVKGVLEVFQRAPLDPNPEWLAFLGTLGGQAAIAIDSISLFNALQRSSNDLVMAYDTTLEGWSRALDLRDKETEGHTRRVTEMTVRLARAMGMSDTELVHVRRGALLHDIGKMGVPDAILLKPGELTDEEWKLMRKHPEYAYNLLTPIAYLHPALDIPYCHHEKWDGTGYPRGLKGEQIPLAARLFAVVDVWDAVTSDRPYRAAWSKEKARAYILAGSGTHFNPKVVETFLQMEE
jgi:PAS domain S-box-containing protein